ncbi:hypothetical protein QBC38DRAFT_493090 [Podospora fimiseda]|uniref:BTB domain-containing protein n=1 Tax=Podospora fimiseda TaxID=252190 RepID=A0AAN6YNC9_9PEZI|nr:hypothetical protein QBC38DRAFT_493090 [Podospora fimiseda]
MGFLAKNGFTSPESTRQKDLSWAISFLHKTKAFTDLTILCGEIREFQVHKAIFSSMCLALDDLEENIFKDSFLNTDKYIIQDKDVDPNVFEYFIEYLYTGNYNDEDLFIATFFEKRGVSTEEVDEEEATEEESNEQEKASEGEATVVNTDYKEDVEMANISNDNNNKNSEKDDDFQSAASWATVNSDDDNNENSSSTSTSSIEWTPDYWTSDEEGSDYNSDDPDYDSGDSDSWDSDDSDFNSVDSDEADYYRLLDNHVQARPYQNKLLLAFRLYQMSEKFGVDGLRSLCIDRFYEIATGRWHELEVFPRIVDELYSSDLSVGTEDQGSLYTVIEVLLTEDGGIGKPELMEKMEWVMEKHGDLAVSVMKRMLSKKKIRVNLPAGSA